MSNEEDSARNRIAECKRHSDKEAQINCMYNTLNDITKAQDITNLTIIKTIDNQDDPRWIPAHMTDNANAIILGITDHKGNPKHISQRGSYVDEKVNSLNDKWNILRFKFSE
jgi:hypothetical protein